MKKLLILTALFLGIPALAQQAVQIIPLQVTTTVVSGTITSTNTFQSIFNNSQTTNPGARGRTSCTVQNNGTHTMYVFFGPIANATLTNSIQLAAGVAVLCQLNGATLQDQVSITGTSGDAFVANQQ